MPYCMYLRKSRADLEAEARGEGETLSRHLQILTRLADQMGLDVPPGAIYREIVSGDTIAARPMMQRLLREVRDGLWEGVLCTEVERLARGDTIDQGIVAQAFKYSGTRIITPNKVYSPDNEMDEEFLEFSLFMARREYKAIARRMQAGRAASVREGHYVGGRRPYGYEVVKCKGQKGCTLRQIPEEARVVRQCFDWYLSGLGASAIAKKLLAMGCSTCNGRAWSAAGIRNMLRQPVYAGYVQWLRREQKKSVSGGEVVVRRPCSDRYILAPGLHEPIVTKEQFERVKEMAVQRRAAAHVQGKQISNPLAGLLKCGLCGYAMHRRNNPNGVFVTCTQPGCACSSAHLDVVLSMALAALREWTARSSDALPMPAAPPETDYTDAIAIAQASVGAAKKQLAIAQDMLERQVYSAEEYLDRRRVLTEKIEAAESEIRRLQSQPTTPEQEIFPALPRVRQVLDAWPFAVTAAEQNALLRAAVSRIEYAKTAPCKRGQDPRENITLNIFLLPFAGPLK